MVTPPLEQLVNMGFSEVLAAEALEATGGDILKATDWLLSRTRIHTSFHPNPKVRNHEQISTSSSDLTITAIGTDNSHSTGLLPPPLSSKVTKFQPKIDCFLHNNNSGDSAGPPSSEKIPSQPTSQPLAERMRPQTLQQVVGQDHVLGPTSALRSAIRCGRIPSLLLWGPPGTGKTSIARAIVVDANSSSPDAAAAAAAYRFVQISAVNSGVKDVRDAVEEARTWEKSNSAKRRRVMKTVLFIDEVHRFNKAQQDSLLPVIEDGSVVFVGATTENPSFHIITPLLSRCTLLVLNALQPHHIVTLLNRAVSDPKKGIQVGLRWKLQVEDDAIEFLSQHCDGDARVALNALEISAAASASSGFYEGGQGSNDGCFTLSVTISDAKEALQCKHIAYDRAGDEHYNLISALHKSMRGSDPDASIYWLARMLEGGEQPLYIARRLIRFASEDVGLADPSALVQAVACYQACHFIGMPECNVNLAQCVCYLALAPKSVSVYRAIEGAQKIVRNSVGQNEGVPLHLRNAPTKLMKDIGYGEGYVYPPDCDSSSVSQTYMPASLQGYKFLQWPNAAARTQSD